MHAVTRYRLTRVTINIRHIVYVLAKCWTKTVTLDSKFVQVSVTNVAISHT